MSMKLSIESGNMSKGISHEIFEQVDTGKNEFSPDEDAHVVADCVKHVLRELPSSPVPASCCTSLLEAYSNSPPLPYLIINSLIHLLLVQPCDVDIGSSQGPRDSALRAAISETFPDPNRRLLQRILQMMKAVVSHKFENLMSTSAVAACMAPLLLRPLLAGDCDLENDADIAGDGSLQFLQAAAAANHAQAIVITLLEEFDKIFLADGSFSSELYSESEDTGIEDSTDAEVLEDDGYHDAQNDLDPGIDFDYERALSGSLSETSGDRGSKLCGNKSPSEKHPAPPNTDFHESSSDVTISTSPSIMQIESISIFHSPLSCITESANKPNEPEPSVKRRPVWSRSSARKNLSLESIDYHGEYENAIQKLEYTKVDLQSKIAKEVIRLQEQLQRERALRSALEAGLDMPLGQLPVSSTIDSKIRADIEEIAVVEADVTNLKNKVADLHLQLDQQQHLNYVSDALLGASGEKVISQESPQPFNKQPSNNEQPDSARQDSAKSVGTAASLFPEELMTAGPQSSSRKVSGKAQAKQAPQLQQSDSVRENGSETTVAADLSTGESFAARPQASSKKANVKAWGPAPAQSALTKLTNRLSFLKERRSHLVSELQVLGTNKVSQGPLLSPSPRTRTR
ncbi:hypothetical protein ACLOJK_016441 [Asimina triloba]